MSLLTHKLNRCNIINMKNVYKSIVKKFKLLRGFFPTKLPVGMTQFDNWADEFIDLYNPAADKDSVKFALATMIMHSGPTSAYKSYFYFYLMVNAGLSKQIAGAKFQEIKQAQANRAKQVEDTTTNKASTDGLQN